TTIRATSAHRAIPALAWVKHRADLPETHIFPRVIRYRARWVVPITSEPVRDGVVAVDGARIAFVGPVEEAPPGDDHDLGNVLLLPGPVNAHTHLELTAMRGFLEALDFRRWILRLTAARRDVLDADALLDSARYGIEEGLRSGVTTFADTSDSGAVV